MKASPVCTIEILKKSVARIRTMALDRLETVLFVKCTAKLYQRIPVKSRSKRDVRDIAQIMLMGLS